LSAPPHTYYQAIPERLGDHMKMMKEDLNEIEKLAIMVDADEEGYLLQIFTKPVQDRPTFFLKLFKEWGAKGNFKALFESIERTGITRNAIKPFFLHYEKITNQQHVILLMMLNFIFV
jgi:4-hydroxyphenylpyruvate dioxygenase